MSQPTSLVQGYGKVTAQTLEDRINMYISAVDKATATNNEHQSSQLQQDIQKLVDLMERISAGQVVTEEEVPPPLAITPQTDVLANPFGELSSRLAEYHKALYFAEEELSEDRMNKIQRLQRGLQTIHDLQKRTQAGFPVRADEIPPPVAIPSDDEFDLDAVSTLESRLAHYNAVLLFAIESQSDKRKIPKIQSAIRNVEFLLTRAKAKRPVWKKDIPPEFEYTVLLPAQTKAQPVNKAKFTLQLRSLQKRVENITFRQEDQQKLLDNLKNKLQDLETQFPQMQTSTQLDNSLAVLTKEVESVEKIAFAEKTQDLDRSKEDLNLIETRLTDYKTAVLASKRDGQVKDAIKNFKVLKGLQALKEALEKGEAVDMTLVPPPPKDFTPTSESLPSMTDLNLTNVTVEVSQNSSGATAHLSPVFIKPALESAEDKLARKLFSYLDKGTDSNLPVSKQMLNISNISTAPVQNLPKVQNTVARSDGLVASSSNNIPGIDKNVSLSDKTTKNKDDYMEEGSSLLGYEDNNSFQSLASLTVECDQNVISQIANENQDQRRKGKEQEANQSNQINEVVASDKDTPEPSLSKSSDIYLRKTLDSVGFLPCQNVPDHSTPLNTDVESNKSKSNGGIPSESDPVEQQSAEVNMKPVELQGFDVNLDDNIRSLDVDERTHTSSSYGFNHVDQPSHDFNSLNQLDEADVQGTVAVTAGSQTSNMQSTALSERQADSTAAFESAQNENNEWNNAVPSYVKFPDDMNSKNLEIGQSGYSDTLIPEVLADVSNDIDLRSSSASLIPDIVRSDPTSAAGIDISHSNSSPRDIGQHVATQGDDFKIAQAVSLDISRSDAPASVGTDAKQDNINGKSSPDTLEFLELMDSMAIPSAAEPVSFLYFSSSTFPLSSSRQSEPVLSSQKPDVLLKDNTSSAEVLAHNSETVDPDVEAFSQNSQSSQAAFMSSGAHLSVDQADQIVVSNQEKPNKPYTSSSISESNHLPQNPENQHNTSSPISSFPENGGHSASMLSNCNTTLRSAVQDQTSQNGLSENLSATVALKTQLGHNYVRPVSSHSQSKSQSTSTTRSTNDFSYSDVAFTCLENLKYDCFLSLAKGTEESLLEEKKLKVKFELIKNKLRNGGKRTWEGIQALYRRWRTCIEHNVYKACVEREHASLVQQIEDLCLLQQWSDVQLLSEKKNIAEREIVILKSRIPELKN